MRAPGRSGQYQRQMTGYRAFMVDGLCALGILKETTGQRRNRVFAYDPYLAQFSDDETTTPEVVDEASG